MVPESTAAMSSGVPSVRTTRARWTLRSPTLHISAASSCVTADPPIWRICPLAVREVRRATRGHGALGLVEVTTVQIQGHDVTKRVVSGVLDELRLDAGELARGVSVAAVEDVAAEQNDGLLKASYMGVWCFN